MWAHLLPACGDAALLLQNVNYPGLRTLYNTYHDDGFNVIAFPCNQ
jgi:glutathione peroxidase-family protein